MDMEKNNEVINSFEKSTEQFGAVVESTLLVTAKLFEIMRKKE